MARADQGRWGGWGVMIIKTHFRRAIRDMAKYLQHLPSTELQNSGARWHCNSPLYPPRNHVATDGLTNTAQQEREGGWTKKSTTLSQWIIPACPTKKKRKEKERKINEWMKSPVLALHKRAAPNKKHCNPIFIVCAPVLLILHCNLHWPRALCGGGRWGGSTCLGAIGAPRIPLFLSREERSA